MLTMTGEEATLTVAGRVVVPGVTATVLTMVVPAGTLSTVGAEEGGIFWVAAAAAANAAMPLICGLLPITCGRHESVNQRAGTQALCPRLHQGASFLPRAPRKSGLLLPSRHSDPKAGVCQQLWIFS